MVGLAPSVENYFVFMGIIITFSILMNEFLFVFATLAKSKAIVQAVSACIVLFNILFCGFIIPPNVIPSYFIWIYWYNPLAWAYRALLINEYTSKFFSEEDGDRILEFIGLVDGDGKAMGSAWIGFGFLYMGLHILVTVLASAIGLSILRVSNVGTGLGKRDVVEVSQESESLVGISFKPVTLSFEDICYDVKTSKGNEEELRLLHSVNGTFRSGRSSVIPDLTS